jgi:hypothetical protein
MPFGNRIHRNSYLVLAIQHDVNNVALFVSLHFLYLVLSRARQTFQLFLFSEEIFPFCLNDELLRQCLLSSSTSAKSHPIYLHREILLFFLFHSFAQ